jgi:CheY-like chemotaxis protein
MMADGAAVGKTVLVVEDNEVEREGLAVILSDAGYTVATALDADGAVASLRTHPETAAVILDMMLEGRDGWDFLRRRPSDPALARVPVVIMTGLRVASREWAESLGAKACFRKPVPVPALLDEIRRLCAP